ncbi:hypothetical protein SQ11_12495 [Nitrosospira sp. NpAV]|nr:hypothetical protein SQ11_12495 [Nitrosospira sp. NpAV]
MAKEKPKRTRLLFDKESIDPAVCQVFFNEVCNGDRKRAGELVNEFMQEACNKRYGPGAEKIIESIRRHLEK